MKQEFIIKFMNLYSKSLFPTKGHDEKEITQKMSLATSDELEVIARIPFAKPSISLLLSLFGCELLYVWDKYLLKMQIIKMFLLFGSIGMINGEKSSFNVFISLLFIFGCLILQLLIILKISKTTRKYNCDMLLTALDPSKRNSMKYKLLVVRTKVFAIISNKEFQKAFKDSFRALKELSDTFDPN